MTIIQAARLAVTAWGGKRASVARGEGRFHLLRYFSIASLVGVVVVVACLLTFYHHLAMRALMEHQTQTNVAVTRTFANTIWHKYAEFFEQAHRLARQELPLQDRIGDVRADLLQQMKGLDVVKVKIYDLGGLTVFSTDPKQIGQDQSANAGFLNAKAGITKSDIVFRHRFDAFDGVISDRNLVSSYVPLRRDDGSPVEAVLEVYSDVSELVVKLEHTQWQIAAAVLGSLALLYSFLFLIVRRADGIIKEQSASERLRNQEKLLHQARHDALTGLPNRTKFTERLEDAIRRAKRSGTNVAVLSVDLDHFKDINDSLGHLTGDRLLQAVAEQLATCVRETDSIARLGGDEFIILVSELARIDDAARVAEKVRDAVSGRPYDLDGRELRVNVSIGISVYPFDGNDAVGLIKSADSAMYHAKEMGRNNYQFFKQDMNVKALAALSMEHSLHRAIERSEFLLHYQPQIDIQSGRIVGAEALIRWQHPENGMVPPASFIPFAEERGLIIPIGDWVLRETCRQIRAWLDAGLPAVPVAVNVSALQFRQRGFPQMVAALLKEARLDPEWLELEMTESLIMHGAETAITIVRELKSMGLKLAIDDFGTGYSSLTYLKRFPVDRLKLDQSFVQGLPDPDDAAISIAVLGMAKALKLKVIAEGVETAAQLELLRSWECCEAQGYYFSKPLPADELMRYINLRLERNEASDAKTVATATA